jgi:propanediol utilization protein
MVVVGSSGSIDGSSGIKIVVGSSASIDGSSGSIVGSGW